MIQFDEHIFQMGWFNHQAQDVSQTLEGHHGKSSLHRAKSTCDRAARFITYQPKVVSLLAAVQIARSAVKEVLVKFRRNGWHDAHHEQHIFMFFLVFEYILSTFSLCRGAKNSAKN